MADPVSQTTEPDEFWNGIWWLPDGHGRLRNASVKECADEIKRLRAEVDRLVSGLLSASIHSSSTLMRAKLMETLEATRHPDVDHWMGREVQ